MEGLGIRLIPRAVKVDGCVERPLVAVQRNEGCLGNRWHHHQRDQVLVLVVMGEGRGGVTKCRFQAVSHSGGRSQPLKTAWQAK